jgi:hypothetical protein
MTFMVHPEHGATNVSPAEVEAHEKNGWVVSTHEEWMALKSPKTPVEQPETPKRIGRPPKAK